MRHPPRSGLLVVLGAAVAPVGTAVAPGFVASRSGSNPVPASFRTAPRPPLRRRVRVRPGQRHRGRTGRRRLREGDRRLRNVILAGGLVHANDLSTWLTYKSADPTGTLAAAQVPLAVDEIGENTWHPAPPARPT